MFLIKTFQKKIVVECKTFKSKSDSFIFDITLLFNSLFFASNEQHITGIIGTMIQDTAARTK